MYTTILPFSVYSEEAEIFWTVQKRLSVLVLYIDGIIIFIWFDDQEVASTLEIQEINMTKIQVARVQFIEAW